MNMADTHHWSLGYLLPKASRFSSKSQDTIGLQEERRGCASLILDDIGGHIRRFSNHRTTDKLSGLVLRRKPVLRQRLYDTHARMPHQIEHAVLLRIPVMAQGCQHCTTVTWESFVRNV